MLLGWSARSSALKFLQPILIKAKKETEHLGAQFHFVYIPALGYMDREKPFPEYSEVMDILQELNIPVLDFYKIISALDNPSDLYGSHLNENGYNLLAQLLEKKFLQ